MPYGHLGWPSQQLLSSLITLVTVVSFCRATHYAQCCDVSVRPSVILVYCIEITEPIINQSTPNDSYLSHTEYTAIPPIDIGFLPYLLT